MRLPRYAVVVPPGEGPEARRLAEEGRVRAFTKRYGAVPRREELVAVTVVEALPGYAELLRQEKRRRSLERRLWGWVSLPVERRVKRRRPSRARVMPAGGGRVKTCMTLPGELVAALDSIAEVYGVSRSALVEALLLAAAGCGGGGWAGGALRVLAARLGCLNSGD